MLCCKIDFIRQTSVSLVKGNIRVRCKCDKGSTLITFNFYKTDYFVSQKLVFSSKLSVKFDKFTLFNFKK